MVQIPLIPYYKTIINSSLNVNEAIEALSRNVDSHYRWRSSYLFCGDVSENKFSISRCISYRNSYHPVIDGTANAKAEGSTIVISMKVHPAVYIFFGVVILVLLGGLIKSGFNSTRVIGFSFMITFMFFLHFVMYFFFTYETKKAEHLLKSIFKSS